MLRLREPAEGCDMVRSKRDLQGTLQWLPGQPQHREGMDGSREHHTSLHFPHVCCWSQIDWCRETLNVGFGRELCGSLGLSHHEYVSS